MDPRVLSRRGVERVEAAIAGPEVDHAIGGECGRADLSLRLPRPLDLSAAQVGGAEDAIGRSEVDRVALDDGRGPDRAAAFRFPLQPARRSFHRIHAPVIAAGEHEVRGNRGCRVHRRGGLERPAFLAGAAVERVEASVAAGDVDDPLVQHRARAHGVSERRLPDELGGCGRTGRARAAAPIVRREQSDPIGALLHISD